jgi:hypothetical protein
MSKAKAAPKVAVVLRCVYSGAEESWSPGDVIEVDASEADRLISMGAAEAVASA